MKPLVVVQARMGSSRMPGKVLEPLAGAPMLQRQLERIAAAKTKLYVCVATSTEPEDDASGFFPGDHPNLAPPATTTARWSGRRPRP